MKTRIGIFVILAMILAQQGMGLPPFNKGGDLYTYFWPGQPNTIPSPFWVEDSLIARYGEMPGYIKWHSDEDTSSGSISIHFSNLDNWDEYTYWWGDSLKWGQVRPYFRALLTSTATEDTLIRELPVGDPNEIISRDDRGGYWIHIGVEIRNIPIPNDEKLWTLDIVPVIDLEDSVEVHHENPLPSIVCIERKTPLDSLLWLNTFQDYDDPDLEYELEVLRSFPYVKYLIWDMFNHYYFEVNCDSVEHYGERYIESLTNNLDAFSQGSWLEYPMPEYGLDSTHVEMIREMIDDICVDGYPQALKHKRDPME